MENALKAAKQQRIVADFVHTEPGFTRSGMAIKRSVTDFVGALAGGVALGIEAKSWKLKRFPMNEITDRQIQYLDALWLNGSLALLALEFRDEPTGRVAQYMIPWGHVPWETAVSARSVTEECLKRAGIDPMPQELTLASYLLRCVDCGGYVPAVIGARRSSCCWSGPSL